VAIRYRFRCRMIWSGQGQLRRNAPEVKTACRFGFADPKAVMVGRRPGFKPGT